MLKVTALFTLSEASFILANFFGAFWFRCIFVHYRFVMSQTSQLL